jgi:hypothetical protein
VAPWTIGVQLAGCAVVCVGLTLTNWSDISKLVRGRAQR